MSPEPQRPPRSMAMSSFRSARPKEGEHLVTESRAEVTRVKKEQGSEAPLAEIGHAREGCLVEYGALNR
jgi:hypothetical protein